MKALFSFYYDCKFDLFPSERNLLLFIWHQHFFFRNARPELTVNSYLDDTIIYQEGILANRTKDNERIKILEEQNKQLSLALQGFATSINKMQQDVASLSAACQKQEEGVTRAMKGQSKSLNDLSTSFNEQMGEMLYRRFWGSVVMGAILIVLVIVICVRQR